MEMLDDLVTLLPELILVALVLIVITVDLFLPRGSKWLLTPLTVSDADVFHHAVRRTATDGNLLSVEFSMNEAPTSEDIEQICG